VFVRGGKVEGAHFGGKGGWRGKKRERSVKLFVHTTSESKVRLRPPGGNLFSRKKKKSMVKGGSTRGGASPSHGPKNY